MFRTKNHHVSVVVHGRLFSSIRISTFENNRWQIRLVNFLFELKLLVPPSFVEKKDSNEKEYLTMSIVGLISVFIQIFSLQILYFFTSKKK